MAKPWSSSNPLLAQNYRRDRKWGRQNLTHTGLKHLPASVCEDPSSSLPMVINPRDGPVTTSRIANPRHCWNITHVPKTRRSICLPPSSTVTGTTYPEMEVRQHLLERMLYGNKKGTKSWRMLWYGRKSLEITPSERSQAQKATCCMISLTWNVPGERNLINDYQEIEQGGKGHYW